MQTAKTGKRLLPYKDNDFYSKKNYPFKKTVVFRDVHLKGLALKLDFSTLSSAIYLYRIAMEKASQFMKVKTILKNLVPVGVEANFL